MERRARLALIGLAAAALFVAGCGNKGAEDPGAGKPAPIVDVHEHIQGLAQAPKLLEVMDDCNIEKTVLMGSSKFTLTLNPEMGFTGYDENNEELMAICAKYPGRFEAWPTIDPKDPQRLEKFQKLVERGAKGLKLYVGHGYVNPRNGQFMFHTVAMDDPVMSPLYAYCEKNYIPVCLHVQPSPKPGPGFAEEFVAVLEMYPDMKVVCPHFMLSSILSSRMEELLDCFPNLYTDISFGYDKFFDEGLKRISKNPAKFRRLFDKYRDRFMFATDCVVTDEPVKTREWLQQHMQAYVDMLTKKSYTTPLIAGQNFNGLQLPPDITNKIFNENFVRFTALRPANTKTKPVNWVRIGHKPVQRHPGEAFPPPSKGASSY